jgi:hypothetical protein
MDPLVGRLKFTRPPVCEMAPKSSVALPPAAVVAPTLLLPAVIWVAANCCVAVVAPAAIVSVPPVILSVEAGASILLAGAPGAAKFSAKVPPLTVVAPVYVLWADRVSVPVPALTRPPSPVSVPL